MTAPNPLGFRFARMLADPAFRQRLPAVGWSSGMTVYPALPGEADVEVKARMEPGRHLLVVEDETQLFGLRMIVCEVDR